MILTRYDPAPIPVRSLDWCAWVDGREECAAGRGSTEGEAVADLAERMEERGGVLGVSAPPAPTREKVEPQTQAGASVA